MYSYLNKKQIIIFWYIWPKAWISKDANIIKSLKFGKFPL